MREHVCAFVRRKGDTWVLVVVPRFPAEVDPMLRTGKGQA
jgi:maltooligosyltrehalose synthase